MKHSTGAARLAGLLALAACIAALLGGVPGLAPQSWEEGHGQTAGAELRFVSAPFREAAGQCTLRIVWDSADLPENWHTARPEKKAMAFNNSGETGCGRHPVSFTAQAHNS